MSSADLRQYVLIQALNEVEPRQQLGLCLGATTISHYEWSR